MPPPDVPHDSKRGQHGDLVGDVDLLELTHPSKDANELHVIGGHVTSSGVTSSLGV